MTAATLTLTDFLLARIAEDEERVRDQWDSDGKARIASMWTGGEPGYTTVAADSGDGFWVADGRQVNEPRHVSIVFDPARVLAECEAKRRIVEQLQRHERLVAANSEKHAEASLGGRDNQEQVAALRTHGWELSGRLEALRMAVDSLAAVYADHEDYRDEWRP